MKIVEVVTDPAAIAKRQAPARRRREPGPAPRARRSRSLAGVATMGGGLTVYETSCFTPRVSFADGWQFQFLGDRLVFLEHGAVKRWDPASADVSVLVDVDEDILDIVADDDSALLLEGPSGTVTAWRDGELGPAVRLARGPLCGFGFVAARPLLLEPRVRLNPEYVENCDGSGCCTPLCDTGEPLMCPGATQECIPWFEDAPFPEYETVGICGIPQ